MHPLASYLTAVHAMSDHSPDDDDLRAWSRRKADAARDATASPQPRRIASIRQVAVALLTRRSARSAGRSA